MNLPLAANWAGKDSESILWLASYPRSGNTFCRILLANYFAASSEPYDLNELHDFIPPDTSAILWHDLAPAAPNGDIREQTWKLRPDFIERYRKLPKQSPLAGLKTHTANLSVFDSTGFTFRNNDRAIYIVRHPLDVLLSYSDFNGRNLDSAIDVMTTSGTCVQDSYVGGFELRGSWSEHVASWLRSPPCPLLLIRYEELCRSTEETLRGMLAFLGAPILPDRVRRAVELSHFDRVREQAALQSFNETPPTTRSGTFFRKGKTLQWLRDLDPEQAYRLADKCMPVMTGLGYTDPREVLFDGRNALGPITLG